MDLRLFLGLAGSALLIAGVITASVQWKNGLFAAGNAGMFLYALLGSLAGGSVFFLILQIFIALSTVSMLLHIPDRYDTTILAVGGLALVGWSLSLFEGFRTALFVIGLVLLGIGFAMDPGTVKRDLFLLLGSAVIATFSYLMRDWIFFGLNAVFALLSFVNFLKTGNRPVRAGIGRE